MRGRLRTLLAGTLFAAGSPLWAAGTVDVSFVDPRHYSDAGNAFSDTARTTQVLGDYLKKLGQTLPDGQALHVEVLDIDLAGTVKHGARGDLRVLRGRADWPSIRLRYTLSASGSPLRAGEESLADLDYLDTLPRSNSGEGYFYEERMLSRWFNERIVGAKAQ